MGWKDTTAGYFDEAAGGLGDAGNWIYNKFYGGPAAAKTAKLQALQDRLTGLAGEERDYQQQGKREALQAFAPADATYKALYGDPSQLSTAPYNPKVKPPVAPRAPAPPSDDRGQTTYNFPRSGNVRQGGY